ncbi:hypothetical protein NDU88_007922 [Pleurodeles waltl]|uniref:Uncharacterized protein n=1 Tax=Pleurodeles waltl TaxID=8319 RepID=A0AAV7U305_PLEWA|nr:hypothetical protein NDU88_007922 [Pleurodeles waltl]
MAVKTTGETYNTIDTYLYRRSVGNCTYVPDSVPARQRRALSGVLKYAYTNPEVQPGSGDVRVSGCPRLDVKIEKGLMLGRHIGKAQSKSKS